VSEQQRGESLDIETAFAHSIAMSVHLTPKQAAVFRDLVQPMLGFLLASGDQAHVERAGIGVDLIAHQPPPSA
jgi:hypothetical protein